MRPLDWLLIFGTACLFGMVILLTMDSLVR